MTDKKDHEHKEEVKPPEAAKPDEHAANQAAATAEAEREGARLAPKHDFETLFYDLVELLEKRASALPTIEGLADVLIGITSRQPTRDTTVTFITRAIKSACNQVRAFQGDLQDDLAAWLEQRKVMMRPTTTEHNA